MFVNELAVGSIQEQVIAQPSWDAAEASIRNLDGGTCDGIALSGPNNSYMGVAGGEERRYVVAGYLHGFGSYICANGNEGPSKDVVVAGDYNTYPCKNVVGLEIVLEAAKAFFERGVLAENLKWEKQG